MSQATMRVIFTLLVVTSCLVAVRSQLIFTSVLPQVHRCQRYMQYLPQCIERSIESMRSYLATGVKLLNIPSFDPYHFSNFMFQAGHEFNGTGILKNLTVHGITNYVISRTEIDLDQNQIKFHAHFPLIRLSFMYNVNATVQISANNFSYLSLTRHIVRIEFTELTAKVQLNGTYFRVLNNSEEYFQITKTQTELDVGQISSTTVFGINSNKMVTDETVKSAMITSLQIIGRKAWNPIITDISDIIQNTANSVFLNFPTRESFPS